MAVQTKQIKAGPKTLIGVVGAIAAALLMQTVPDEEGTRYRAYKDIVGVWTICTGDTYDVTPGLVETPAGCDARLQDQLIKHAEPVIDCTPGLADGEHPYQLASAVSLTYNIGTRGYCRSTAAKHFKAGRLVEGCNAYRSWNMAGGRVVRGLDLRRRRERQMCLTNLIPGFTPENLKSRMRAVR